MWGLVGVRRGVGRCWRGNGSNVPPHFGVAALVVPRTARVALKDICWEIIGGKDEGRHGIEKLVMHLPGGLKAARREMGEGLQACHSDRDVHGSETVQVQHLSTRCMQPKRSAAQ